MELFADDYISLSLAISTLALNDSRSAIRNLIRHTPIGNAPVLLLKLGYQPDQTTKIDVDGGGITFFAAPESTMLAAELASYLAPRVKAVQRVLEQRDQKRTDTRTFDSLLRVLIYIVCPLRYCSAHGLFPQCSTSRAHCATSA